MYITKFLAYFVLFIYFVFSIFDAGALCGHNICAYLCHYNHALPYQSSSCTSFIIGKNMKYGVLYAYG